MKVATTEIFTATTEEDYNNCFAVIKQLRPHLKSASFSAQIKRQQAQGYILKYCRHENKIAAIIGCRPVENLAWGKAIYIDDLVTAQFAASNGYGRYLLDKVCKQAKQDGYNQVHLDTGPSRHTAHKLYINYGFILSSHHMVLKFND